ncbi:MAG: AzlC family ABC transporter permease [Tissierellaceae bacterium]|nr:AzlC family ABC transporter permease [Tissierellaceae bacterium]
MDLKLNTTKENISLQDESRSNNLIELKEGIRDGIPIALGYLPVSFTLGIAAKNAGLTLFQGFLAALLTNASAGGYAGFLLISSGGTYWEMAMVTIIANARYFLMGSSLSQKLNPDTPLYHRLLIGYDLTDELFGISIARKGWLNPYYFYGAMLVALPAWSLGTASGVAAGNILSARVVSALSVALYGMFLAIIIPPAKKNRVILALVILSFISSFIVSRLSIFSTISSGTQIIILTVVIAGLAAILFPVSDKEDEANGA